MGTLSSFGIRAVLFGVAFGLLAPSVPAQNDPSSLAQQVTIRRTDYGVPHILAENYRALGFGLGYAQAQDHLHSIMRLILTARGELALNFGAGDKDANLKSDLWNRQYRIYDRAAETYDKLDADWRAVTEGFASGINYYIQRHRDQLESWIQPVTPQDIAAHGLTGVARFAFNRGGIVDKFIAGMERGQHPVVEPEDMGSNLWAFSGDRTTSGNTILMGNPHQPWNTVATYYEAQLTIPGTINFYGSTFIGRPVLTTGFNDYLGWTHTVNYPDLEEIYALDVDPDNPDHYLFEGASLPLQREDVTVQVREMVEVREPIVAGLTNTDVPKDADRVLSGAPAAPGQPHVRTRKEPRIREVKKSYWYSELGPVIYRTADQVYVLKSVAYDEFRFYQQWFELEQARSYDDFRAILDQLIMPMFNIGYADRDGNIYYLWNGTVPELPHASHGAEAVHARGWGDVWTKVHPIADLPQLLNPKGGYVMNSNSAPYFTNLNEPLNRFDYPPYFVDNRFSLRSQHSMLLIHNDRTFSLEDVVRLKFDQRAVLADRVKDDLVRILRKREVTGDLRRGMEVIAAWDGTTVRNSRGGPLFELWWERYSKGHGDAENFARRWVTSDPIGTPMGIRDEDRAFEAFRQAVAEAQDRYDALDAAWGEVHRMRFADGTDLPIGGAENNLGAFRVIRYHDAPDGKKVAYSGDSWVFAVEFSTPPKAYSVVAYSESEYVDSPHYSDQAPLFASNRMKPVAFTEEDIQAHLVSAYHPGEERPSRATTD